MPFQFWLGLDALAMVLFQVLQTAASVAIFTGLLFTLLTRTRLRRRLPGREGRATLRKVVGTGVLMEAVNLATAFLWYYLVLYAVGGFVMLLLFYACLPYLVFSYQYEKKPEHFTQKTLVGLYVLTYLPATLLGQVLVSAAFTAAGFPTWFVFS